MNDYMLSQYSPTKTLLESFLENEISLVTKNNAKFAFSANKSELIFIPELNLIGTHTRNKLSRDYQSSVILVEGEYYRVLSPFFNSNFEELYRKVLEKCSNLDKITTISREIRSIPIIDSKAKKQFHLHMNINLSELDQFTKVLEFWKLQNKTYKDLQIVVVKCNEYLIITLQ